MTSLTISPPDKPPYVEPKRPEVRGKLRDAIMLMVYEGLPFNEAAKAVNFDVGAMRKALAKPHVIRFLREQKQVFRASASAANISALVALRDKSGNAMAQLGAIKVLEGLDDEENGSKRGNQLAGLQIVVVTGSASPPTIDVKPARIDTPVTQGCDK